MDYPQKPLSQKKLKRLSKYLAHDEKPVLITGISNRYFWLHSFFFLILSLVLIGIPKLTALIRRKQSFTYALTNRRFLIIRGIFSRKIVTAPLDRVTHVTVEQSFLERFLYNSGQLIIITAGFDQREIVIEDLGDPINFKILMEELTVKLEGYEEEDKKEEKNPKPEKTEFKLRQLKV